MKPDTIPIRIEHGKKSVRVALAYCSMSPPAQKDFLRSAEEQEFYEGLKTEKRRSEFVAGRRAAYHALGSLLAGGSAMPKILPGLFGEPTLGGASSEHLELSIAHTKPWALALASEAGFPVAIDIERSDNLSKRQSLVEVMTTKEKSLFPNLVEAFSAKEALAKFLRCGFTAAWQIFEIGSVAQRRNSSEIRFAHFSEIHVVSYQVSNFIVSFALHEDLVIDLDTRILAQALEDQ